jgi:mersacidin/lichenicidin family type 2 lantibiotic
MSQPVDIARAWKDEEYREKLSGAERVRVPANPAGLIELTEVDLASIAGGMDWDNQTNSCPYW